MKITIFNLNTWLLPTPFSKDKKRRIIDLIALLKKLNPDIAALQEVARKRYIGLFKKELDNYYFTYNQKGRVWNKPGLLTLTKKKPISSKFVQFRIRKKRNMMTRLVGQGFFEIKLSKDVYMYNVHLHPDDWKDTLTFEQFEFLKSKIKKHKLCFVCGDLNMNFKDFEKLNNGFFESVDSVGNTFSWYNMYVKKWWERNVTADKKLDYILVRNPDKKKIVFNSRAIRKPILSDHYGIYSEIEVN